MARAVIFDLDGTLADSLPDIAVAVNDTLTEAGHAPLALDAVRRMVGDGARRLVQRAFAERGEPLAPDRLDRVWTRFVEVYDARPCVDTRLYPGAREALERLARDGWRIGICTNKPQSTANLVIDALELRVLSATLVGGRPGVPLKPAPDMVLAALSDLGATPSASLFVGDSKADVGAGRSAGLPVVLLSHGYTAGEPVHGLGADLVIDHLDELDRAVRTLGRA